MFDAKAFLKSVPARPGVYCMKDAKAKVLYVGKAKNLKNRLSSYFNRTLEDVRIQRLVEKIADIDITVTPSEKEALLLENSLIKSLKPHYNVIFRDDKTYPYLFLSKHTFPRLIYCRGKQKQKGQYFGPYPSALAVKETLNFLQKTFKIRQCDDTFFKTRSRPCLQYQIERCTAPCVGYIDENHYDKDVEQLKLFLLGKNNDIINQLVELMENRAGQQDFEQAAHFRDQIISLRAVFDQQSIYGAQQNIDVIAVVGEHHQACIHHLFIREGRILTSQSYFTKQYDNLSLSDVLRTFILQSYMGQEKKHMPHEIVLNKEFEDQAVVADTLGQVAQRKVKIGLPRQGNKLSWLKLAIDNAQTNLSRRLTQSNVYLSRFDALKQALQLTDDCKRVECFDISHTQGVETRASCVVFNDHGADKSEYRQYRIQSATNDDYQSMTEVLTRRYLKRKQKEMSMPDLVIIDGGKGQLNCARKVFKECQIDGIQLLAIAKGPGRKPGLESLFVAQGEEDIAILNLAPNHPALLLLQQIRDEAHRFAITQHKKARAKRSQSSALDGIAGVGEKRKHALIQHFGGLQALMSANQDAIAKVPGISTQLAEKIYEALHK